MFAEPVAELSTTDDDAITGRFRDLELQRRRIEAEMAAIVAEGERRSLHAIDGHRSMKHWVRAQTNCPDADAARLRRLSRATRELTAIGEELCAGHIGASQANELARLRANPRCGHQLEGVTELLLRHAEHLSFEDFRVVARRWETLADLDGAERNDEASHERRAASVRELHGALDVRASGGTGATAAEIIAIFDRFVQQEFDVDVASRTEQFGPDAPASCLPRSDAQRRFDALAAIFRAAVVAPADGVAPEPVVNFVVGLQTYERLTSRQLGAFESPCGPVDLDAERMESTSGIPVSPADVIAATVNGVVRRVVIDAAGVVVDAGRKRRLFTGVAREMALLLAHGCDHLGCTVPADRCDVDHVREWTMHDGPTDQRNAGPRCSAHNSWKSANHLRTWRSPEGYTVDLRADGSPMIPVGRRVEPTEPTARSEPDPPSDGVRACASCDEIAANWQRRSVRTSTCLLHSRPGRADVAARIERACSRS